MWYIRACMQVPTRSYHEYLVFHVKEVFAVSRTSTVCIGRCGTWQVEDRCGCVCAWIDEAASLLSPHLLSIVITPLDQTGSLLRDSTEKNHENVSIVFDNFVISIFVDGDFSSSAFRMPYERFSNARDLLSPAPSTISPRVQQQQQYCSSMFDKGVLLYQ